jgi:hypothetical protein
MNDKQRLQLQNMINTNNVEDNTNLIRELKHSIILQNEIDNLVCLRNKYANDLDTLNTEAAIQCNFLFTYYTDIYNKVKKDEINLNLLNQFLNVLREIEDGKIDQHEGSFKVGTILKEIYIDSAIKKGEKLDKENAETKPLEPKKADIEISWSQYKKMKL